ncbi:MAG: hypothetical protein IIY87_03570 [Bacteroidales bacterium]|nr:hypothetical protein [Bacteroidales bacterium]
MTKWLNFPFYELNRQTRTDVVGQKKEIYIKCSRFIEVRSFYAQTVTIPNAQQRKFFNAIYVKGRKRYIPALTIIEKTALTILEKPALTILEKTALTVTANPVLTAHNNIDHKCEH